MTIVVLHLGFSSLIYKTGHYTALCVVHDVGRSPLLQMSKPQGNNSVLLLCWMVHLAK